MYDYENTKIRGIYASRYIASFAKTGAPVRERLLRAWLRELIIDGEHLNEQEISRICNLADEGKFELEQHAKKWLHDIGL